MDSHSGQGDGRRISHGVSELGQSTQRFVDEAQDAVQEISQAIDLKGRVERHPLGMVALAAGVGYLLGGGLFTPLTGRVVNLGIRLAALPFVKDELVAMAEAAVDGIAGGIRRDQPLDG